MSIRIRIKRGVNTKEEKLHQQIFNSIFQNDIKKSLKINKLNINLNTGITKDPYFIFPVLYSPNEPVHFLGFFLLDPNTDPGGISLSGSENKNL